MQDIYKLLVERKEKLAIIGLGYVGLPLAAAFSKKIDVVGFDINRDKVEKYKRGLDVTGEIGDEELKNSKIYFTSDERELSGSRFFIIAVPTPVTNNKQPDLGPVTGASTIAGRYLQQGSMVVYESTVYPGLTEEICIPILEKESGLRCGADFKVGYSPERINPGDRSHTIENIVKIVSGIDEEALETLSKLYMLILKAGVYKAESIKVAEAAKVIENTQRDINIAFMNELSIIFHKMGLDTQSVLKAAGTKWNFLGFVPGLVGGHCIGVDPYYLTFKAEELGYHPEMILSGRRINDGMGKYIAENTVKLLIKANRNVTGSKVLIMGIAFKENVPDVRNSKTTDIINELREYGITADVWDPAADRQSVCGEYGIELVDPASAEKYDAVIFTVAHNQFRNISLKELLQYYSSPNPVLVDVKSMFDKKAAENLGYIYWRL